MARARKHLIHLFQSFWAFQKVSNALDNGFYRPYGYLFHVSLVASNLGCLITGVRVSGFQALQLEHLV